MTSKILFDSVKQEQIPIAHIVDNTKKMKLDNSYPHFSYPKAMDECSAEISQMNLRRENLKRKQFMVGEKYKLCNSVLVLEFFLIM